VRRDKGMGGIYREGDRWVGELTLGRGPDGKRIRRRVRGRTKAEVKEKLRKVRETADAGIAPGTERTTLSVYLPAWLDARPVDDIAAKTRLSYRLAIEGHILPSIGDVRLCDLTPAHVRLMLAKLEERGLGTSSRRTARAVLRRALRTAQQDRLVSTNAAAIADAPQTTPAKTDDTLTVEEIDSVLTKSKDDRLHALAVILLMLGLRSGEARALRWSDIDLEAGTLTVSGTLEEVPGHGLQRKDPKTEESARTIPLIPRVVEALKAHRVRQAEEELAAARWDNPDGYVFTTTVGTPINSRNALRWWKGGRCTCEPVMEPCPIHSGLLANCDVAPRRIHAARHSAASYLLAKGVPLELVSRILGHSSIRITADTYSRISQDAMRRALSEFEQLG
jgi:integrase